MNLRLKKMLKGEIKRKIMSIYTGLFMVIVFSAIIFSKFVSILPASATFCSFEKTYPYGYESKLKPNVLIIIDTSTSMLDAPNGSDTYGDGSKPVSKRGNDNYEIYWGKETNPNNNDPITGDYLPDLKYISVEDFQKAFGIQSSPGACNENYLGHDPYYGRLGDGNTDYKKGKIKQYIDNYVENHFNYDENEYIETPTEWIKRALYFQNGYWWGSSWKDLHWESYNDDIWLGYLGQPTWGEQEDKVFFDPETCTRYRYPNDSRIYQVKLVLWNLLNDPEVTGRLRIGLSTFYQEDFNSLPDSWTTYGYKWPATANNWNQYFSKGLAEVGTCGADTSRILLCEPVDDIYKLDSDGNPVSSTDHLDEIFSWINGIEIPGNSEENEIRAHGNTPIYYIFEQIPLVFDPLSDYNDLTETNDPVIQNWCQDNFIILLTDGVDQGDYTDGWNYYQHTSSELASRFGHFFEDSKKNFGAENETGNIRTLVIGFSTGSTDMKNKCNAMADAGWDGSNDDSGPNGENNEDQAYMAANITELTAQFKEIFHTISDFSSSSGSPLVTVEEADENNTEVYQASYYPKKDDMWEGHFRKYAVTNNDDDTSDSTELWDGSAQLEEVSSSDRKIYTVITQNLDSNSICTQASFDEGSLTSKNYSVSQLELCLRSNVGLGDNPLSCDILFNDLLGEVSQKKLGDIYHSGFVKVGLPASEQISEDIGGYRDTMIYVQANDGMLHAFYDEGVNAGKEHWAFIPPNVLCGGRLKGLKIDSQGSWIEEDALSSKYLCDGPVVVEDVQFDGNWKTVLLGCLGYGGTGLYALDVTDPDDPDFLWALENDIFDINGALLNPGNMTVKKWTSSEFQTLGHSESGPNVISRFKKGLFSMSTPFIGHLSEELGGKWIALVGNGSKMDLSMPDNIDGGVFAIDVANGNVIHFFTGDDVGNIVSPIVAKKISVDDPHLVEIFYVADDKGQIWEVDLSKFGEEGMYTLLSNQLPDPRNGISYSLDLANINEKVWLFAATGDFDRLVTNQNESQNYVFGINTFNTGYDLTSMTTSDSGNPESQSLSGWILELDKENSTFYKEYITGMPYYYRGYVFFSTFKQGKDTCSIGDSRLYCLKASSCAGGWDEGTNVDKYVTLHNVRITGLTISNDMMYIGATRYVEEDNLGDLPEGFRWAGEGFNLLIGPAAHVTETGTLDANSVLEPLYWRRHNFRMP